MSCISPASRKHCALRQQTIQRVVWVRVQKCRPAGFQSPPCASAAPRAAFLHTPSAALLKAPAMTEHLPLARPPPGRPTRHPIQFLLCYWKWNRCLTIFFCCQICSQTCFKKNKHCLIYFISSVVQIFQTEKKEGRKSGTFSRLYFRNRNLRGWF